jgi:hypothetical protein
VVSLPVDRLEGTDAGMFWDDCDEDATGAGVDNVRLSSWSSLPASDFLMNASIYCLSVMIRERSASEQSGVSADQSRYPLQRFNHTHLFFKMNGSAFNARNDRTHSAAAIKGAIEVTVKGLW